MREKSLGVSFILCTYNGALQLAETLACLAAQKAPADLAWEVVFVDNASTDGSAEIARKVWAELGAPAPLRQFYEPKLGYKAAMQRAIDHVAYRYACIVDDDNHLDPNYLTTGVALLEQHPNIGILGGPNTPTFEGAAPAWFPAFQHCYASGPQLDRVDGCFTPLADGPVGRNVLWGAGMFVRTKLWQQLRAYGFTSLFTGRQGEANLTAGEDDELCYLAQLLGYQVWYSTRLHLYHYMVTGRLSEAYRDRLFYASARATPRLNAYRNALWGQASGTVRANLLKDWWYAVWGIVKSVCQPAFVEALLVNNRLPLMNQRHALAVVLEIARHRRRVKNYYEEVLRFKQRLNSPVTVPDRMLACVE